MLNHLSDTETKTKNGVFQRSRTVFFMGVWFYMVSNGPAFCWDFNIVDRSAPADNPRSKSNTLFFSLLSHTV